MERCTYPNCDYTADFVSNNHTKTAHELSRKDVIDQYGQFPTIKYQYSSRLYQWIKRETPDLKAENWDVNTGAKIRRDERRY